MVTQDRINQIINEETENVLLEEEKSDSLLDALKEFVKKVKKHKRKHSKKKKKRHEKKKDGEENTLKTKKTVKGGKTTYDYTDYKERHKDASKGDTKSLVDTIDQERTNIRDLAKDIYPDHTDAGAQSQLRKVLNGERKLTKDVAHKLSKGITSGKIAVKQ